MIYPFVDSMFVFVGLGKTPLEYALSHLRMIQRRKSQSKDKHVGELKKVIRLVSALQLFAFTLYSSCNIHPDGTAPRDVCFQVWI